MRVDKNIFKALIVFIIALALVSCSFSNRQSSGGYYQDDGPGNRPIDASKTPNATPRYEKISRAASKPYTVHGKNYVPLKSNVGFRQQGLASWYGKKYHGRKTSNGEIYDMYAMTAAHTTLPIPSYVRVTNLRNQRSVVVRVNDRGPFIDSRIIDLSYVAAKKLDVISSGTAKVLVEAISSVGYSDDTLTTSRPYSDGHVNGALNSVTSKIPQPQNNALSLESSAIESKSASTVNVQWLQAGAFSVFSNAEKLKKRLYNDGFVSQVVHSGAWYKVVLGPLNASETFTLQQRLRSFGYLVSTFKE